VGAVRADARFLLVVTGRDVEPFVAPLVESLAIQTRRDWRARFVDDASCDGTRLVLEREIDARGLVDRIRIATNAVRRYKAHNVFRALQEEEKEVAPAEIVVLLDADDRLADPRALERLDREYRRGFDVVWSNWRGSDGSSGKSDHLSPLLPPSRQPFVSQHLFSFRRTLFAAVSERDLQDDEGAWFRAGCDAAIAWPVLARTRRWRFVNEPLCVYNRANPESHRHKQGKREQIRTLAILRERARRPLNQGEPRRPADLRFVAGHAGTFFTAVLMNARLVGRYIRHERRLRDFQAGRPLID
jgi:glycosyltransferase involved in cell wall biosynthesis